MDMTNLAHPPALDQLGLVPAIREQATAFSQPDLTISVHAPVAVLPCCQAEAHGDAGGLDGWLDNALAIDVTRAARLRAHGYHVHTQTIPEAMTAKNRLLLAVHPPP